MKDAAEMPEVGEDAPGSSIPANENPWYILMTLYGELEGRANDQDVHEANRRAWNAWVGSKMPPALRSVAAFETGVDVSEFDAWDDLKQDIEERFEKEFFRRNSDDTDLPSIPDPEFLIDFSDTLFSKHLSVAQMAFPQEVFWGGSDFLGFSDFMLAAFLNKAGFFNVVFHQEAFFKGAKFVGEVHFDDAVFKGTVHFGGVKVFDDVSFRSTTFSNFSFFDNVTFGAGQVGACTPNFSDCQFAKPTTFRKTVFRGRHPIFDSAVLHDKTSFTAEEEFWPTRSEKLSEDNAKAARESCAVIRHALAKQGLPEDEHFFFRREMQFARQIGSFWQRLPYRAFGWFSEYGYSIERPLLWLLGVWVTGFCVFATLFFHAELPGAAAEAGNWTAAGLSFSNLFPVFGFGRLYFGAAFMGVLPGWAQAFAGFQTVAALPLLFFLGLALRQRFRLR